MTPSPRSAVLPALLASAFAVTAPTAGAAPAARPLTLSVGVAELADMPFDFRPYTSAGTAVTLWVDGFDAAIVRLDGDRSRVDAATDAGGNDLLAALGDADRGSGVLDGFPRVRDDGGAMMLNLNLPGLATGGGPVAITGELVVVVATGTAVVASDAVAAGPGEVAVGAHTLEIKSIGPNGWNPEQSELTLTASAAFVKTVRAWTIRDGDGAPLHEGGPQSTMTVDDFAQLSFPLASPPVQLRFELEVYEGLTDVAVPLDLRVGLGLE